MCYPCLCLEPVSDLRFGDVRCTIGTLKGRFEIEGLDLMFEVWQREEKEDARQRPKGPLLALLPGSRFGLWRALDAGQLMA